MCTRMRKVIDTMILVDVDLPRLDSLISRFLKIKDKDLPFIMAENPGTFCDFGWHLGVCPEFLAIGGTLNRKGEPELHGHTGGGALNLFLGMQANFAFGHDIISPSGKMYAELIERINPRSVLFRLKYARIAARRQKDDHRSYKINQS